MTDSGDSSRKRHRDDDDRESRKDRDKRREYSSRDGEKEKEKSEDSKPTNEDPLVSSSAGGSGDDKRSSRSDRDKDRDRGSGHRDRHHSDRHSSRDKDKDRSGRHRSHHHSRSRSRDRRRDKEKKSGDVATGSDSAAAATMPAAVAMEADSGATVKSEVVEGSAPAPAPAAAPAPAPAAATAEPGKDDKEKKEEADSDRKREDEKKRERDHKSSHSHKRSRSRGRHGRKHSRSKSRHGSSRHHHSSRSRSKSRSKTPLRKNRVSKFSAEAVTTTLAAVEKMKAAGANPMMLNNPLALAAAGLGGLGGMNMLAAGGIAASALPPALLLGANTTDPHMQNMLAAANPQLTRMSRRLFVGNLPIGVGLNEKILTDFFNKTITELGIATPSPVLSVWLSGDGSYCFVEMRGVRDTTAAMTLLQGVSYGGRALRVGRPADFKPPPPHLESYVVGMPVGQEPPPPTTPAAAAALAAAGASPASLLNAISDMIPPAVVPACKCVVLKHMMKPAELVEADDFEDLYDDIKEECEKLGPVESIVIPRPPVPENASESQKKEFPVGPRDSQADGRVLILFGELGASASAIAKMHNRTYNFNTVTASYYPEDKFKVKEFLD